jgi:hypothetical protein
LFENALSEALLTVASCWQFTLGANVMFPQSLFGEFASLMSEEFLPYIALDFLPAKAVVNLFSPAP